MPRAAPGRRQPSPCGVRSPKCRPSRRARPTPAGGVKRTRLSVTSITSASIAGRQLRRVGGQRARAGRCHSRRRGPPRPARRGSAAAAQAFARRALQRSRPQRLAGAACAVERPPELEREERIASRCVDDLEQRRPRQCESEALAEQRLHALASSPPSWTCVMRSLERRPGASERSSAFARAEMRTATVSLRSRRNANSSTARDDVSSQWTSSRATSTGCSRASSRRTLRKPAATRAVVDRLPARRGGAASSARRCGRGRPGNTSAAHGSRRSERDACDSSAPAATGCADRTKYESAAATTALRQSVVFPIPASPSSTRAAGSPPSAARNRSRSASPRAGHRRRAAAG